MTQTNPEQITEAEQLAVPNWIHQLASHIVLRQQGVGNAGVLMHRAFADREARLVGALEQIATVDMGGGFLGAQACRKVALAALKDRTHG